VNDEIMKTIAEMVATGKCILFLGAGVHASPPDDSKYSYPETERPLLGRALAAHLAGRSKFVDRYPGDSPTNLQRVAFDFELYGPHNRKSLIKEIRGQVEAGKKPSPALRGLADLDFPLVMTTNYDTLFETALVQAGKKPFVGPYEKERYAATVDNAEFDPASPFVYKIHGDIEHPESVVVTDEDYIDFVLRMSDRPPSNPIPDTFALYFKHWPILFLGYRLTDYNLRLLFKTLRWNVDQSNVPKGFAVDPFPDVLIQKIYGDQWRYLTFIISDVWTFVPDLYCRVTGKEMPK
jgi:SIR2-like protein